MGRWKALFPFLMAIIVALTASFFLYRWLEAHATPKDLVEIEKTKAVPVAVAAIDLPWGTKLEKGMIKEIPFLRESLPGDYVSGGETLVGRVTVAPLKVNEPVTQSKLAPTDVSIGGVSALLQPGQRAIAVKGDKVIGLSGLVRPGHRVDVLVTLADPRTKGEVTKVVLENVLVLATGTQIQEDGEGKPAPVDVYTLEVTPEDGEKLALASAEGRLQFALRGFTDKKPVLTRGATVAETLASLKLHEPAEPPAKRKVVRPRTLTVEVIKDGKVVKQEFRM